MSDMLGLLRSIAAEAEALDADLAADLITQKQARIRIQNIYGLATPAEVEGLRGLGSASALEVEAGHSQLDYALHLLSRYEYLAYGATLKPTEDYDTHRVCPCCTWPEGGHKGPGRYRGNAENTHEEGCSLNAVLHGKPAPRLDHFLASTTTAEPSPSPEIVCLDCGGKPGTGHRPGCVPSRPVSTDREEGERIVECPVCNSETTEQDLTYSGCPGCREPEDLGASKARRVEALSHVLDEAVARWHEVSPDDPFLFEWLVLTREQYAMYVECRWDDLIQSLASTTSADAPLQTQNQDLGERRGMTIEDAKRRAANLTQFALDQTSEGDKALVLFAAYLEAAERRAVAAEERLREAGNSFEWLIGFLRLEGALNDDQRQDALTKARRALAAVRVLPAEHEQVEAGKQDLGERQSRSCGGES